MGGGLCRGYQKGSRASGKDASPSTLAKCVLQDAVTLKCIVEEVARVPQRRRLLKWRGGDGWGGGRGGGQLEAE